MPPAEHMSLAADTGPEARRTPASVSTMPFAPFEWMLASRYLRARRKEGFISVIAGFSFLGIMLGVATLIIVMAVMNGFRAQLLDKIMGLNGHVAVYKEQGTGPFDDYEALIARFVAVPSIRHVVPVVEGQVMVSSPADALGGLVRGVTETGLKSMPLIAGNIKSGTLDGFDSQDGIAIGTKLAKALGLKRGDFVTLLTPQGVVMSSGVAAPRSRTYRIQALFEMGMVDYDKTMIFMPMSVARAYFSKGRQVDALEVMTDDPETVDATVRQMQAVAGPGYGFTTWRERNLSFFTVLAVESNVMMMILSLIIMVAALNIISGLMMLVKDKGRDIAILRTMGATRGAMMRVFLITGAAIGIFGTLAGLLAGVLFVWRINDIKDIVQRVTGVNPFNPDVYYLSQLPAEIDVRQTTAIVLLACLLSVLATLYPSWRASTLDPVEALRYE